jgi:DNA-binding LacI/PurR family transcriptional regulator
MARVVMQDVADHAGVSIASVSRVLSGKDGVSQRLTEQVLASASELGFRSNRTGRALRKQRTDAIGLVISDVENPFFASLVRAVEDLAHKRDLAVLLCNTDEDLDKERFYFELMIDEQVTGVIVAPSVEEPGPLQPFLDAGTPVVCVDRRVDSGLFDAVLVDNRAGARALVEHLVDDGHRNIGLVVGTTAATSGRERVEGSRQVVREWPDLTLQVAEGELQEAIGLERTMELGGRLALELLSREDPPSAILCANNLLTQGVLRALKQEGVAVPRQTAVVGWDDLPVYELLDPPLTVVAQPTEQIGHTAAELLFKRIEEPAGQREVVLIQPELLVRGSCADHQQGEGHDPDRSRR